MWLTPISLLRIHNRPHSFGILLAITPMNAEMHVIRMKVVFNFLIFFLFGLNTVNMKMKEIFIPVHIMCLLIKDIATFLML